MSTKTFYLAGPMTGIPQFNFPAFDEAAKKLRERGWDIVSPAELDEAETRADALASPDGKLIDGKSSGKTWGDFLARDVKLIADQCGGVVFLPGWEKSKGAKLEAFVALLCKYEFHFYLGDGRTERVTPSEILYKMAAYVDIDYSGVKS